MSHNISEIIQKINNVKTPAPNSIWIHYKGEYYKVIRTGIREFNEEIEVIYHELNNDSIVWIRPLKEWNQNIFLNGKKVKRFSQI